MDKKEVHAELDKKFEKEVFEKNEESLKDKAGLEKAPEVKQDVQLANLIETAKRHNQNLNRETPNPSVKLFVDQKADDTRKPYTLSPLQQEKFKAILKNSGADSASQIKAYDQLKALLEEVV